MSTTIEIEKSLVLQNRNRSPYIKKQNLFTKLIYFTKLLLACILVLILVPIILILFSPLYLFRWLIYKISSTLRPDLAKILSSRSAMLASDSVYNNPQCVIVGTIVLKNKMDFHKFSQQINEEWIQAKLPDGSPEFPELTQFITTWLGYSFWKPENNFRVENHYKVFVSPNHGNPQQKEINENCFKNVLPYDQSNENNPETVESVNKLMDFLVKRSFDPETSPWGIVAVENYKFEDGEMRSAIVFRWHHSLMDGLSCFRLISRISDLKIQTVARPKSAPVEKGFLNKLAAGLSFLGRFPYESITAPVESIDQNDWHLNEEHLQRDSFLLFPGAIPMEKIQKIKNTFQVTFSTVIFALITGGLRNFMMKTSSNADKIPRIAHVGLPFPYPGHPDKLRNHMAICTAKIPVGISDSVERLYWLDDHLDSLRNSTIPFMSFHIVPFIGSLPLGMLRELVKNKNTTVMFSNMPGPQVFQLLGQNCIAWSYTSGHGPGCVGLSVFALTYNNFLRFSLVVDKALAGNSYLAEEFAAGVTAEVDILFEALTNTSFSNGTK